jgi:uncharacterized repeat protein (TIGR03843 family)
VATLPPDDDVLEALSAGDLTLAGQFMWGSNYTFLVEVQAGGLALQAVYKPVRGERPLWDFPAGSLAGREVAAYQVSRALGWDLVPPTVLRRDGPAGPGSLQLFVDADPERHYFTFSQQEKPQLRPVAAFDVLINNADRKGGHILLAPGGRLWVIDHGVCFHAEDKLRTVVWDFAGEPIPPSLLEDLRGLRDRLQQDAALRAVLEGLLEPAEVEALARRVERLLAEGRFPWPGPGRPLPWPPV